MSANLVHGKGSRHIGIKPGPPRKPPEGDACNGCGLCCAVQLCPIVIELLPDAQAPCPAMEFNGERFWCGLIRRPSRYLGTPLQSDRVIGPMAGVELAIGQGCDAGTD